MLIELSPRHTSDPKIALAVTIIVLDLITDLALVQMDLIQDLVLARGETTTPTTNMETMDKINSPPTADHPKETISSRPPFAHLRDNRTQDRIT